MPAFALPSRSEILEPLETLAIGSAGGLLFLWAQLPGGLISGAMIAVAGAGIAGRPLGLPQWMANIILMTLGLSLGAMVSPAMIKNLGAYPVSIALLAAATFGATFGSSVMHGTGWVEGGIPQWAYLTALIGIGILIGSRFGKIGPRTIFSHIAAALGSFAVAIAISAVSVAAIALVPHVKFSD